MGTASQSCQSTTEPKSIQRFAPPARSAPHHRDYSRTRTLGSNHRIDSKQKSLVRTNPASTSLPLQTHTSASSTIHPGMFVSCSTYRGQWNSAQKTRTALANRHERPRNHRPCAAAPLDSSPQQKQPQKLAALSCITPTLVIKRHASIEIAQGEEDRHNKSNVRRSLAELSYIW